MTSLEFSYIDKVKVKVIRITWELELGRLCGLGGVHIPVKTFVKTCT